MTKDEAPTSPKDAALTLALEALEEPHPGVRTSFTDAMTYREKIKTAITAIKEALAQPMQRPWVGLTEDEIACVTIKCFGPNADLEFHRHHARAVEAKLKEKNT